MKRVALALCLAGCGAADEGSRLPMDVLVSGLAPADVGSVQLVVLANGTQFVCTDVVRSCLKGVADENFVRIRTSAGEKKAVRIESASALLGEGQTTTLEVKPGANYMFVAQALSPAGKLLAGGCEVVSTVSRGTNGAVQIRARVLDPAPDCDPVIP